MQDTSVILHKNQNNSKVFDGFFCKDLLIQQGIAATMRKNASSAAHLAVGEALSMFFPNLYFFFSFF